MKLKASLICVGLLVSLAGCSGKQAPPPKTNVFSSQTKTMDKAKQVNSIIQKQAAQEKKQADADYNQ